MEQYIFDIKTATEYGVNEAIMIKYFQYWIFNNKVNNRNYYDGRYWTYNSKKAFTELFPFWSIQNIKTILKHLIEKGVILTGNYNKNPYDRTLWYAFVDEEKWIGNNRTIQKLELTNEKDETNQPIPYNKPNNKPNNNIPPLYSPQGDKDTLDDLTRLEDSLWYSKGSDDKPEQIGLDKNLLDNQFMGIGDSTKSEDVKQEHPSLDKKNKSPPLVPPQKGELFKEQFEEFWKEYPKKRAGSKDKAYKSWLNAIKRGNSIEKILTGCKNYSKSDEVLRENGKYAKGCSAWLNDDRFNNEYSCKQKDLDYYLSQLEKEGKE